MLEMKAAWVAYRAMKGKNSSWDVWLLYLDNKKQIIRAGMKEREAHQLAMQMNLKNKNIINQTGPDTII